MNIIQWFINLLRGGGGGGSNERILPIYVLSRRCNEPLAGQVDLYNELSLDEDEKGYFCRKVLHTSGESRCFDQVEVNIWFDSRKNMTEQEVVGGRWLSEAEYEQELVRFRTPPDTDNDIVPTLGASSSPATGPRPRTRDTAGDDRAPTGDTGSTSDSGGGDSGSGGGDTSD